MKLSAVGSPLFCPASYSIIYRCYDDLRNLPGWEGSELTFFLKFVSYRSKLAVLSNVLYYTVVNDIFVHRLSYLTPPNNDICSIKKMQTFC